MDRRTFLASALATVAVASCGGDDDAVPATTGGASPTTAGSTSPATSTTGAPQAATTAAPSTAPPDAAPVNPTAALAGPVFTLGVASGDPTDTSVILWTRLAPTPMDGGGMPDEPYFVRYEIAADEQFTNVLADGYADALPQFAHSVHVEAVDLQPDTFYWYRFSMNDEVSPVGRARTMPTSGGDQLRFVFGTCQEKEAGYYAAWRHAAADTPDVVIFLGDYIYEGAGNPDGERPTSLAGADNLQAYRDRYGSYKMDTDLQAAHAIAPWMITWDDHEVANDYSGDIPDEESQATNGDFRARKAQAYQAWYEHMPVRLAPPEGSDYRIYRSFRFGDLAEIFVLDGRQYRQPKPCLDGDNAGTSILKGMVAMCAEGEDEARSLLGDEQEAWLIDGLTSSTAQWKILANDVFMFGINVTVGTLPPTVLTDTWDGFPEARRRLMGAVRDNNVDNVVVLTGDFHCAGIADIRADPFDLNEPVVASEFMTTSISSDFDESFVALATAVVAANTHVKFFDVRKGYGRCTVDGAQFLAEARALSDVRDVNATCETVASYKTVSGVAGFVPA
jgi:alkaline phosphatase D